jgi:hypothetical protein
VPIFESHRAENDELEISIKVRIDDWVVDYRPGILEVLKYGWIQYLASFIFVGVILYYLYDILIRHQVMRTIVTVDNIAGKNPYVRVKY